MLSNNTWNWISTGSRSHWEPGWRISSRDGLVVDNWLSSSADGNGFSFRKLVSMRILRNNPLISLSSSFCLRSVLLFEFPSSFNSWGFWKALLNDPPNWSRIIRAKFFSISCVSFDEYLEAETNIENVNLMKLFVERITF